MVVEGADEGREVEEGRVCCEGGAPWEWEVVVEGLDIGLGEWVNVVWWWWRGCWWVGVVVVARGKLGATRYRVSTRARLRGMSHMLKHYYCEWNVGSLGVRYESTVDHKETSSLFPSSQANTS